MIKSEIGKMDIYAHAITEIIKQQQSIIGPIAVDQARRVSGLDIKNLNDVKISGNAKEILEHLVHEYENLFGKASIEFCKDVVKELKPPIESSQLPDILR